jgi:hypothetical protein
MRYLLLAALLVAPAVARADYHVISPYEIDLGELEIEHNGSAAFDHRPDQRGATSYTVELGTGLTSWWHSEIELGFDRAAGDDQPTLASQLVTENNFQLTEPGEYPVDLGFYVEYGQSLTRGRNAGANEVTFGPLFAKDIGRTTHTLNLLLTRQFGPDETSQGLDFSYAWQSRWNIWEPLSPAIEIYGDAGTLGATPRLAQQQLLVGPVGVGLIRLGRLGNLKYELGWLVGATSASPAGVLRWRTELEVPF